MQQAKNCKPCPFLPVCLSTCLVVCLTAIIFPSHARDGWIILKIFKILLPFAQSRRVLLLRVAVSHATINFRQQRLCTSVDPQQHTSIHPSIIRLSTRSWSFTNQPCKPPFESKAPCNKEEEERKKKIAATTLLFWTIHQLLGLQDVDSRTLPHSTATTFTTLPQSQTSANERAHLGQGCG